MLKLATFSFNDGRTCDKAVLDLLKRRGIRATFYLPTSYLAKDSGQLYGEHEIGGHTVSHPDCRTLPQAQREHELVESRAVLQQTFGQSVECFAWPYGISVKEMWPCLEDVGYRWARAGYVVPLLVPSNTHRWDIPVSVSRLQGVVERVRYLREIRPELSLHIAAHSHDLQNGAKIEDLDVLVTELLAGGYDIVPNTKFFEATVKCAEF